MTYHYRSLNQVNLIGRIGKAPVLRSICNGSQSALVFSLCTEISRKDPSAGWTQVPTWHNCVIYGPAAEQAHKVLSAGSLISLVGRIVYNDREKNGVRVRYTDIVAESFQLLAAKQDAKEAPPPAQQPTGQMTSDEAASAPRQAALETPKPEPASAEADDSDEYF